MEHVALDLDLRSSHVGDIEGLFVSGGTFLQESWLTLLGLTGELNCVLLFKSRSGRKVIDKLIDKREFCKTI